MDNAPKKTPLLIGWKEMVSFPEWGIRRVKVKVDTGARTSALDVVHYELHPTANGLLAELHLALNRRHPERLTVVRTPVLKTVRVRNTSGQLEPRPLIETTLCLGPVTKRVRLTVADRSRMLFRIILGRQALLGNFVVDVSRKYVLR
jgi:hypothetical protein